MADVSNPELKSAYQEVLSDSNDTNWCLFGYEAPTKIALIGKGSGGFAELAQEINKPAERLYAYIRVVSGDAESKRAKFAFIAWCGSEVGGLARGKVSVHKASIKQILLNITCEFSFEDESDLNEEAVMEKIRKSGGADYSGNKSQN